MKILEKNKTLLDSVHGNIEIPSYYFDKVIDTPFFQRLRRIEQNSCRSVYPSARHDRFIHSIGVFYIGCIIADTIWSKFGPKGENILPDNAEKILETYKLACLLHDIGHTPFSHTFEYFFNYDKITEALKTLFNDESFNQDLNLNKDNAAPHELISAFVAVFVFKDSFNDEEVEERKKDIDWLLLARMITGCQYIQDNRPIQSFENIMIELIHGKTIDADGLDYVCRDVWAGGYRTFNIDLKRLINSIIINKEDHSDNYCLSFSSKALNEIETVLNVKNFQYLYVQNHHKVLLEQYYLKEGMKSAAAHHLGIECKNEDERDNALRSLCDFKIFLENKTLKSNYNLFRPIDDDFVCLMKQADPGDRYISQWFSRRFSHIPLWKSKLEFFNIFKPVFGILSEKTSFAIADLLKKKEFKNFIATNFDLDFSDIIVEYIKPKIRSLDASKINVSLNGKKIPYSKLNHDMFALISQGKPFCYVYIDITKFGKEEQEKHIQNLINAIMDYIWDSLKKLWDEKSNKFFYES